MLKLIKHNYLFLLATLILLYLRMSIGGWDSIIILPLLGSIIISLTIYISMSQNNEINYTLWKITKHIILYILLLLPAIGDGVDKFDSHLPIFYYLYEMSYSSREATYYYGLGFTYLVNIFYLCLLGKFLFIKYSKKHRVSRCYPSSLRLGASRHPPQEAADEYKPCSICGIFFCEKFFWVL